jgi:hypothetical protein
LRILAFDISTSFGWLFGTGTSLQDATPEAKGTITLDKKIREHGAYPFCFLRAADLLATEAFKLVAKYAPDVVVIEETNLGKSRYSQKILEFAHCMLIEKLSRIIGRAPRVVYLDSSSWRKSLGLALTKEQKKQNTKLATAKREAAAHGWKLDKKKLGIAGKVTKKHVAINYVNERFGWTLKAKDDDIADATCLFLAFLNNAEQCDGT